VLFAEGDERIGDALQRQFVAQILQGAVSVEQSKALCGRSLAHFSGLKKQRDGLDAQADADAVLRVYERNAELLSDGPNRGDLFYFDPHIKELVRLRKQGKKARELEQERANLDARRTPAQSPGAGDRRSADAARQPGHRTGSGRAHPGPEKSRRKTQTTEF